MVLRIAHNFYYWSSLYRFPRICWSAIDIRQNFCFGPLRISEFNRQKHRHVKISISNAYEFISVALLKCPFSTKINFKRIHPRYTDCTKVKWIMLESTYFWCQRKFLWYRTDLWTRLKSPNLSIYSRKEPSDEIPIGTVPILNAAEKRSR